IPAALSSGSNVLRMPHSSNLRGDDLKHSFKSTHTVTWAAAEARNVVKYPAFTLEPEVKNWLIENIGEFRSNISELTKSGSGWHANILWTDKLSTTKVQFTFVSKKDATLFKLTWN